jgi:hypothetical protein
MKVQYYAITKYGTTKAAPFALVRLNQGIFEEYRGGDWVDSDRYDGILIGDFSDYDVISAEEAESIQKKMQ